MACDRGRPIGGAIPAPRSKLGVVGMAATSGGTRFERGRVDSLGLVRSIADAVRARGGAIGGPPVVGRLACDGEAVCARAGGGGAGATG